MIRINKIIFRGNIFKNFFDFQKYFYFEKTFWKFQSKIIFIKYFLKSFFTKKIEYIYLLLFIHKDNDILPCKLHCRTLYSQKIWCDISCLLWFDVVWRGLNKIILWKSSRKSFGKFFKNYFQSEVFYCNLLQIYRVAQFCLIWFDVVWSFMTYIFLLLFC